MARAQGARASLLFAFEERYGEAPSSGYIRLPFISSSLGAEQPLIASDLLGYGRDPAPPVKDVMTVDGDLVVPVDTASFGLWLKAAFGVPSTTYKLAVSGSSGIASGGHYHHSFLSGKYDLPSFTLEIGMPDVPRYATYSGCVLDSLSWTMGRSGLLSATVRIVAQGETVSTSGRSGNVTQLATKRFGHANGSLSRDDSALGNVVSADITYTNNLDRIETIRDDGQIDGADPSVAGLTGSLDVRFADTTLVTQAVGGDPCKLVFKHELVTGEKLEVLAFAVYLPRPRIEITGPQGVQVSFDWQAAHLQPMASGDATRPMCKVELHNLVEDY